MEAEELLVLGARFFPDDAEMAYRLGRVRLVQGRLDDGLDEVHRALSLDETHRAATVLLTVSLLRAGRIGQARGVLAQTKCEGPDVGALSQWVQWRRIFSLLAGSLFVVGSFAVWRSGAVGLLLALTGVGLLALGWVAFTRFLDEV